MKLQFKVTFKDGPNVVSEVTGRHGGVDAENLTIADVGRVVETEQFLERLTGLRCHIEQIG